MKMNPYAKQNERAAHAAYWNKPDPVVLQKLAFISGYLLLQTGARVGDMGCGRGEGSFHLALLNPHLDVVGVDNNPDHIRQAREKYKDQKNLTFILSNIEDMSVRRHGRFDGFLNSSVMHHVSSYNGYDKNMVKRALALEVALLNPGGVIALRDFAAPEGNRFVYLNLPHDRIGDTPVTMSNADLLVHFSRTAKSLARPCDQGFFLDEVPSSRPNWRRFYLSEHAANEYALRKDYREAYDGEVQEEYGYDTPSGHRRTAEELGLRVEYAGPFYNRWIRENRFEGQMEIEDEQGRALDFPPTNYVMIARKVERTASHSLRERSVSPNAPSYLKLASYRAGKHGAIYDIASRPGGVVDFLPYLVGADGTLSVAVKNGYPRPLANVVPRGTPCLDGKIFSGHFVEPVAIANVNEGDDLRGPLARKTGLEESQILEMQDALTCYPQPDVLDEIVDSRFIRLDPAKIDPKRNVLCEVPPEVSGFSTSGHVALYRAQDLLRSAQVGVLPEARLELNLYALMRFLDIAPEAWLDGAMKRPAPQPVKIESVASLVGEAARAVFVPREELNGSLAHKRSLCEDLSCEGRLAAREFEFVLPTGTNVSANVGIALPLVLSQEGEMCLGLEETDRPGPQLREGNSRLFVAPLYHFGFEVDSLAQASRHVAEQLGCLYSDVKRLGEAYYPSIGVSPMRYYPFAAFPKAGETFAPLHYVKLTDFFANLEVWRDAPLMIGALRAIHAMGLWEECAAARSAPLSHASVLARKAASNACGVK